MSLSEMLFKFLHLLITVVLAFLSSFLVFEMLQDNSKLRYSHLKASNVKEQFYQYLMPLKYNVKYSLYTTKQVKQEKPLKPFHVNKVV